MTSDTKSKLDSIWREIELKGTECRRAWGCGFPLISIALLKPFWDRAVEEACKEGDETVNETVK